MLAYTYTEENKVQSDKLLLRLDIVSVILFMLLLNTSPQINIRQNITMPTMNAIFPPFFTNVSHNHIIKKIKEAHIIPALELEITMNNASITKDMMFNNFILILSCENSS